LVHQTIFLVRGVVWAQDYFRNTRHYIHHTVSIWLTMTSWEYKTGKTAATTRRQLAGDPGTSLLSDYTYV